jgi:hypothetical protein
VSVVCVVVLSATEDLQGHNHNHSCNMFPNIQGYLLGCRLLQLRRAILGGYRDVVGVLNTWKYSSRTNECIETSFYSPPAPWRTLVITFKLPALTWTVAWFSHGKWIQGGGEQQLGVLFDQNTVKTTEKIQLKVVLGSKHLLRPIRTHPQLLLKVAPNPPTQPCFRRTNCGLKKRTYTATRDR